MIKTLAGVPFSSLVRFLALFVTFGLALYAVSYTPIAEWLDEERLQQAALDIRALWWAPALLLLAYVGFGSTGVPSAPLFVAGAVFGPVWGTLYNMLGLLSAAVAGYLVASVLGRDFVLHLAKGKIYRLQRFFTRFGFWPLVQARFLPIPDTVLNFTAALSGVPFKIFVGASALGIFPSTLIHTVCLSLLLFAENNQERAWIGVAYLGSFVLVNIAIGGPWLLGQWKRRQRYQQLLHERAIAAKAPPLTE